MMTAMPRGDASVQTAAEIALRAEASRLLGADLTARRLTLPGGNHVAVDGVADEPRILCEIFARVGTLKGGQVKKIAEDLLKLVTVRQLLPEWAGARIVLVFASQEAHGSVRGWLLEAVRAWNAELLVVPVEPGLRERLLAAQQGQWMGYPAAADPAASDQAGGSARRRAERFSYGDDAGLTFYDADGAPIAAPRPPASDGEAPGHR
jgi:hypothetical protein